MKQAYQRKVWWPVKLRQFDDSGAESDGNLLVLFALISKEDRKRLNDLGAQVLRTERERVRLVITATAEFTPEQLAEHEKQLAEYVKKIDSFNQQAVDIVRNSVQDWRNCTDSVTGETVPFTTETLDDLLRYEDVQKAFTDALLDASVGARTKN